MGVFLGKGSHGKVIKVKNYKDNKEYAMKVVKASKMKNKKLID